MGAIMGTAMARGDAQRWAPLIIGGALGLGALALAPLTGAGFNPARAFGPAIASGQFGGADVFIVGYLLAPVLGALAAAFGYQALALAPRGRGATARSTRWTRAPPNGRRRSGSPGGRRNRRTRRRSAGGALHPWSGGYAPHVHFRPRRSGRRCAGP